jgi:hypothetical protein
MTQRFDQYGDVVVPVTAGTTGGSLAASCDPALSGLLSDFATILKTRLDAAWTASAALSSLTGHVVDTTYLHEPDASVARLSWCGPALFMWRASEKHGLRTVCHEMADVQVKLAYLLPPMPIDIAQKLEPIRVAVRTTLLGFVRHFGDPTLHPNGDLLSSKGITSFDFTESRYGYFDNELNSMLPFAALDMTATMREREEYVAANYATFTRVDTTVTSAESTGTGLTVASTRYP